MRLVLLSGTAVLALAACAFGGSSETADRSPEGASSLRLVRVASGLVAPVDVVQPASEPKRLYVVEQAGRIRVLVNGRLRAKPFLDIRSQVASGGERGLLSVAFHPDYARNHLLYVDYTDVNGNTRVVRYRSNGRRALPGTAKQLLFVRQPYANHNGGQLVFGPDGRLYVGLGDGGSAGDPGNRAQSLSTRLGKILRLNVDRAHARWTIAAYGLRNPWRFTFDRATGAMVIGDVGQGAWEEVDYRTRAQVARTWNYGWSVYEGSHRYDTKRTLNRHAPYVGPIAEYSHAGGNCSITGGYVYRGSKLPAQRGRYFYGDYCSGSVWSFRIEKGRSVAGRREPFHVSALTSFGEGADGELYLVSQNGAIYRLAGR